MSPAAAVIPRHLGIIPDGNRRWAKERGLNTLEGHRRGLEVTKRMCYAAIDRGVDYMTVYVFSTENWRRAADEVSYLMNLFVTALREEIEEFNQHRVRLRIVGRREGLSPEVLAAIDHAEEATSGNDRGTLALCLNYGGEQELADACGDIIKSGVTSDEVTPQLVEEHLYQADIPPLDLIVRTSGERRLSGFMLARASYAELSFSDVNWPDFSETDLDACLADYAARQRRFGV